MYKAVHFKLDPVSGEFTEILSALLDIHDFEGIYEDGEKIIAYADEGLSPENILEEIQASMLEIGCRLSWELESIPEQNWNRIWESNFEPVILGSECVIRAPFHPEYSGTRYQIIIEPKMSFGTGHHQTTRLMIEQMLDMDMKGRKVLDMGCGTGVLGIFAALKDASEVIAIDIDRWAYENALENVRRNGLDRITVLQGDTGLIVTEKFDIILANINRNILTQQMEDYSAVLDRGGVLLVSGIVTADKIPVQNAAERNGFRSVKSSELDDWLAMMFERN